jgi:hypothetical protein
MVHGMRLSLLIAAGVAIAAGAASMGLRSAHYNSAPDPLSA